MSLLKVTGCVLSLVLVWSTVQATEVIEQPTESTAENTVDINTADMHTIARVLDGIGEKKAAAIVTYREEHGPFESVVDLENVYGIGDKIIEKNLDKIVISQPATDTMSAEPSTTSAVIDETKVPMNQSDVEETLNIQE